jgi:hypothetical protein
MLLWGSTGMNPDKLLNFNMLKIYRFKKNKVSLQDGQLQGLFKSKLIAFFAILIKNENCLLLIKIWDFRPQRRSTKQHTA